MKDGPYLEPEAEEEEARQTEAADAKKDFAPSDETEMETAEGTAAVPAIETDEEDQEDLDDFEEESEARPESVYMDGENLTGVLVGEIGEKDAPGGGEQPPPVTTRPDSPAGRARALLEKGMSPVEVSKQTGMGRGAVDLLAQMVQRQRKSESVD